MTEELDVLRMISERLRAADVPFMLTDTFALGYYGRPRMTRDLYFVVALMERHVDALVSAFSTDFYIDEDAARTAIKSQRMFKLMHLSTVWLRTRCSLPSGPIGFSSSHAECADNLHHGLEARIAIGRECLVKAGAGDTGLLGELHHATSSSDNAKRVKHNLKSWVS